MLDFGFYNEDCLPRMKEYPNNFFDLAIVDPPYGIGVGSMHYTNGVDRAGKGVAKRRDYRHQEWDFRPDEEYFKELLRISKKQIIWGGNYFSDMLPPSRSFIVWDKRCLDRLTNGFADCEYAWASKGCGVARMFRYIWDGMLQNNMKDKEDRIHPTQKPVALYEWILTNYAKPGDKILDTHAGSGSSLIACENLHFKYVGFEIDKEYYDAACKRIADYTAQISMF